jgi:hypothetical protein
MTAAAAPLQNAAAKSPPPSNSAHAGLLLQRKCACGSPTVSLTGACTECTSKKFLGKPLQRKLRVNEPGDEYEQEADRVAAQVMRMAKPAKEQNTSATATAPLVQRKVSIGSEGIGTAPPVVHDVLSSPGQPLDAATRAFFESRFGHDFSGVRVHSDTAAEESAQAVNAHAYTVGQNVVFGAGRFAPASEEGRRLIAHELTHTIQQGASDSLAFSRTGGALVQRSPADPFSPEGLSRGRGRSPDLRHGSTLPYQEATELLKCIEIMGEENNEYCRQEVLGEKPIPKCAKTHTIPDDVYAAIDVAWAKSGHGGATVTEHGGRLVTDKTGKRVIRTGSGGGGSISLPAEKPGDFTLGTFHTHPYSKSEGSDLGVAFSGGDITNFVGGAQGSVKYIGAGSCHFVLDTLSYTDRDECKKKDLNKRWNDTFSRASGAFQEKVESSVIATIAGCGLCFYKTCRPDDASPVPKNAKLVS